MIISDLFLIIVDYFEYIFYEFFKMNKWETFIKIVTKMLGIF